MFRLRTTTNWSMLLPCRMAFTSVCAHSASMSAAAVFTTQRYRPVLVAAKKNIVSLRI